MAIITSKVDVGAIKQEIGVLITYLAKNLNEIDAINSERDKKINKIKEDAAKRVIKQRKIVEEIGGEIYKIFKANRALLTDNGRKNVLEMELGKVGVHFNGPSVWPEKVNKATKEVFDFKGLGKFIRIDQEYFLNKTLMVADPELFKGINRVSITKKDVFVVEPVAAKNKYSKEIKRIRLN